MAMLTVEEALARVLADAAPLAAEDAALADAVGRVLAADVAARRTQPPDDVSAMDGYAVRGADVAQAPVRLTLLGEVAAGRPFPHEVAAGQAVRIFTGGVMPKGSDTVVIQELTARDGDDVIIQKATAKGRNVRVAGLDFRTGERLLTKGQRLHDRDLSLAAAMNHPKVPVHRRPRIAVFATGDELVMPGTIPGPGQIVYSNGYALTALARAQGAEVIDLGIVPDTLDATIAAVRRARDIDADILVTTGGASVGDYDLVQPAFAAQGMSLSFWKVALRPGRPLMHGKLGAMHVLGLPGNPVSAYVCALLFLTPLIRRLSGRTDLAAPTEGAVLGVDMPANDERADYMRATLEAREAGALPVVTPFPIQDSSMLRPLAASDCLLVRPALDPAAKAGTSCRIIRLQP